MSFHFSVSLALPKPSPAQHHRRPPRKSCDVCDMWVYEVSSSSTWLCSIRYTCAVQRNGSKVWLRNEEWRSTKWVILPLAYRHFKLLLHYKFLHCKFAPCSNISEFSLMWMRVRTFSPALLSIRLEVTKVAKRCDITPINHSSKMLLMLGRLFDIWCCRFMFKLPVLVCHCATEKLGV